MQRNRSGPSPPPSNTADLDANAELDHLLGPIYHRVLVTGDPVDEIFIDHLVGNLLLRHAATPGGRGLSATGDA